MSIKSNKTTGKNPKIKFKNEETQKVKLVYPKKHKYCMKPTFDFNNREFSAKIRDPKTLKQTIALKIISKSDFKRKEYKLLKLPCRN